MEQILKEQIEKFNLTNEVTENPNIWVGCGVIGGEGQPSIEEAKKILEEKFGKCIADSGQETPEWLVKTLKQWENYHPYQHVREKDQPLFIKKLDNGRIVVAVIWPWQIKKGKASLMVYKGQLIE
ncbi:MAG: hypothetical protein QXF25_01965 [Candidatus Pacearchaeota archaeon]